MLKPVKRGGVEYAYIVECAEEFPHRLDGPASCTNLRPRESSVRSEGGIQIYLNDVFLMEYWLFGIKIGEFRRSINRGDNRFNYHDEKLMLSVKNFSEIVKENGRYRTDMEVAEWLLNYWMKNAKPMIMGDFTQKIIGNLGGDRFPPRFPPNFVSYADLGKVANRFEMLGGEWIAEADRWKKAIRVAEACENLIK